MKPLLLAIPLIISAITVHAAERDWTVERPWLSGFVRGASLGMCASCAIGAGTRSVSEFDPFAAPRVVQKEMARLGRNGHLIGAFMGFLLSLGVLVVIGRSALLILRGL